MFVTFAVLKLLTSKLVNDEQERNIDDIFVAFDVSKLLKSKAVNDEQP